MSYSNGSGGTLTLPSPTHVHHVDVGSAVRSLRRSLSRSPSKFKLTGRSSPTPESSFNFGQSSATPAPAARSDNFPISTTPASVVGESASSSIFATPQPQPTSISPFRSTVKLSVRSARAKTGASRPLSRTRVSPKSPLKRVFGPSQDFGNQIPSSISGPEARGQENLNFADFALALSPVSRHDLDKPSRHSMHLDVSGSSKSLSKFIDFNEPFPSTSVSPLKRSDATMSLDHSNPGSPVAKRRSLHGIPNLDGEFSIFDLPPPQPQPQGFDVHEDISHEYQLAGVSSASPFRDPLPSPTPGSLPKRSSSLRKSTLQQRSSFGKRAGEKHLAHFSPDTPTIGSRTGGRPRLSVDSYDPLGPERGSPFNPQQAPLPNPSLHLMSRPNHQQPHPLSNILSQSSSGSSLADESPTHVPIHISEKPRAPINFSRSLPVGAQRPLYDHQPVATPEYKRAKPFQAAFMSTGLVSKMTRNPEMGPPKAFGTKVAAMPDTPCKKQYNSATYPPQLGSGRRQSRASIGSPSTPFGPAPPSARGNLFGSQDKPNSLFFQQTRGHARKSSLLSLNGDDQDGAVESSDDFPPTPTKNLFSKSISTPIQRAQTPTASRTYTLPASGSAFGYSGERLASTSCKSQTHNFSSIDGESGDHEPIDGVLHPCTPSTRASSPLAVPLSSFNRVERQRTPSNAPASLDTVPGFLSVNRGWANRTTETDKSGSASTLNLDHVDSESPRTPRESIVPPDPSFLSISNSQDDSGNLSRTPATPTTQGRRIFPNLMNRRLSITPQHDNRANDIDDSLSLRFDRSDLIGQGEFSQVYRVVSSSVPTLHTAISASTPNGLSSVVNDTDKVFAVKRIRIPTHGIKERQTKLREVEILETLKDASKVVHYIDSWEQSGHLYIQTEFCTEGSLDTFLKSIGHAGRLDDFRIWKILLETAEGLAAIHKAGIAHLDLKPANIFITFDGYLKIGDFGLATWCPAPKGIEGEGDREYIGPEILLGQFDRPADIFSLGLIVLEIACNVFLPDNGPTWQALRVGDLSAVPSLTSNEVTSVVRDVNGMPIDQESSITPLNEDDDLRVSLGIMTHDPSNLFGPARRTELQEPPAFMVDPSDSNSLDIIVQRMIQPNPADRPTAQQLLSFEPLSWVSDRRTCGATVYEGNWGPHTNSVEEIVDTEMTDV